MEHLLKKAKRRGYMRFFLYQMVPLAAVVSSAVLALHSVSGWGWFLFVAFMLSGADTVKKHLGNDA